MVRRAASHGAADMSTSSPSHPAIATAERPDHEVAIVGAGISGIGVADALLRAGFTDLVLLERAGDVGGTWRDNTYPGVGVDVPAQAYQFSRLLDPEWPSVYASGAQVKAYVDRCADVFGVRPHVRLHAEVLAREWDASAALWRLRVGDPRTGRAPHEVTARFVVGAIGPFPEPRPPVLPGLADFAGDVLHTAAWDHDVALGGRRVAVVGTGASAVQIVPEIAEEVAHLDVHQRTPAWVSPKVDPPTPRWLRAAFRRAPALQRLVRRAALRQIEAVVVTGVVRYDRTRWLGLAYERLLRRRFYARQVPDPVLRARLTPRYGFACKRTSASSTYLATFTRPDVELVTDPIERVTATGVRTADGTERPVDVLVLATGYRLATEPEPYDERPVRGRDGHDLAETLRTRRAHSYESVAMPGLPNHFTIFGAYGWTGGSWHVLVETAAAHIVRVLGEARRRGAATVEVRPEAAERWTADMRRRLGRSIWAGPRCAGSRSYYVDRNGDVAYLRPTSARQARRAARTFPLDDYAYGAVPADAPQPAAAVARRAPSPAAR